MLPSLRQSNPGLGYHWTERLRLGTRRCFQNESGINKKVGLNEFFLSERNKS